MMRALLFAVFVAGCGTSSPVGPVRFHNAPPAWRVNDRVDVPETPRTRPFYKGFYHVDSYYQMGKRGLNLTRHRRAQAVNSLDEVPDSTWFTNRIGVRPMSVEEIRRGPGSGESPELYLPWQITRSKSYGDAIGFFVEDRRGRKFLLKFDEPHAPEVETGADVVVGRLLWAAGYNVPADHVVYFKRSDLGIAPGAYRTANGKKVPVDDAFIDRQLAQVAVRRDGLIRGLASMWIEGTPIGGASGEGVRADDPNDRVPHQLRRDQRGLRAFAAWLGHNDLKEDNTLDTWQADPADPSVHYVVHYLLDFGKALGGMNRVNRRWSSDFVYNVDLQEWTASLMSLGLHRQPWEGRPDPQIRGIGLFSATHYDPARWKPNNMGVLPVMIADRFDQFWGAKILINFTREQIAAAVEMGRYSDPRAAPYLVDTLVARQRKTARHWFRQVNPIDELDLEGDRLCFTDLALRHRLETAPTQFSITAYDASGRLIDSRKASPDARGRACLADFPLASDPARYTILRVESSRRVPGTLIHLAVDPATGRPRVVGLHRL